MAMVGALLLDDKHAWTALSPGSELESFPRTWSIKARFLELPHQAFGYCLVHLLSTFPFVGNIISFLWEWLL